MAAMAVLFWLVVAGAAIAYGLVQANLLRQVWRREAAALGIREESWLFGPRRLTGVIRGCAVRVERFKKGDDRYTRFIVRSSRIPPRLELKPTGIFGGTGCATGDAVFDGTVRVSGEPATALAFLGRETRAAVAQILASGGFVKDGALVLELRGRMAMYGEIRQVVGGMLGFIEALPAASVPSLLRENAASDIARVRLRNLELLAAEFPGEPDTRVAAEAALADREPAMRLLGAKLVRGERGKTALASLLFDGNTPLEILAEAVRVCGETRDAAFVDPIVDLAKMPEPHVAAAVAAALGKLGDPKAEPALLRLLAREHGEVCKAAAAALGQVGSVHAVEALLAAGFKDPARRIQARLIGAEAGRLSIAQDEAAAGALSPAAGDAGQLSVVKTKA